MVRVDAAVNSGNTLASWAELTDPATSVQLLTSADAAYRAALQQEEDAAVSWLSTSVCAMHTCLLSINRIHCTSGKRF